MPSLSVITSFRDRDTVRVRRFLESLAQQSDQDFHLIFLDYGSKPDVADQVNTLCHQYGFCRYVYNDTRGMLWNRSHAMNSAARFSDADFILFTDIDLIFAPNAIERLKRHVRHDKQLLCRAYYLPRNFSDYTGLSTKPLHFRRTSMKTKGLFHCMARSAFEDVGGFDSYYRIWGIEDSDLATRLRSRGFEMQWLDSTEAPMYHQWHPESSKLSSSFPTKWWENMALHTELKKFDRVKGENNARLLMAADRPTLNEPVTTTIRIPRELEPPGRARAIRDILFFLQQYPGQVLEVMVRNPKRDLLNPNRQSGNKWLSGIINLTNKVFRTFRLPVELTHRRHLRTLREYTFEPDHQITTPEAMQYVIHRLITDHGLISDYCIEKAHNGTTYRLVGGSPEYNE